MIDETAIRLRFEALRPSLDERAERVNDNETAGSII
jgi:hypothetical protein